ncbi:RNA polymerase sigma factor [Opitutus sp. ER46]|uniref:RNA polymerase sigma factor n=1 Tax=Opitutus sp. ER46 TaxID=2161864 RepID=UPI000D2FBC10|nr:RNA polymerase sigma factor [Opitutus sp. ER46]PTX90754.1 RNA polymerase subunit sigma [Opitutus sp. ER46]
MNDPLQQLERDYADLAPSLRGYFLRRAATCAGADDFVQETFLRACREPERLRTAASPRAYLFGIARHLMLDAVRRAHPTEPLEVDVVDEQGGPADDRLELLRVTVAALPEAQREPLRLKLQHDLSYAEIADVLGVPVGTVRSRLHYAVRRLHEVLNPAAPDASSTRSLP